MIEVKPPSSFEIAVELYRDGELRRAEEILRQLRQSQPERAEVALYLGRVHFERQRYGEAVAELEAATVLDGAEVEHWLWLGRAMGEHVHEVLFLRKLPMAKRIHQIFLRAVELDPDSVRGHTALARFYSEAPAIAGGDRDRSLHHAAELIRLDPVEGHRLLSSIYLRFEEPEAATRELRAAIAALEADGDREDAEVTLAEMRQRLDELSPRPGRSGDS